ncbi:MAG: molybdopterin-dependent oxidoreductase [Deltaproteobacteria bacterium]|nr:molybdopterin-dependent oxidoreductase [Deltaproteobacteria bacterium]
MSPARNREEEELFDQTKKGSPELEEEVEGYTICDGCNQVPSCGIKFYRRGDIVTRIEPWPGFPASPLCSKAYATLQRLYHPERLIYPMKRTNPKGSLDPGYVQISWDEAYGIIVDHLNRIKKEYGPHAVFFYVGDPKEPRAAVQRLAAVYGSVNYGCESSTACRRAAQLAELLTYGFPTMGGLPSEETRVMLIWGTNPAYSGQPFLCHGQLVDAKERGVKFIVVDPRITPTAGTLADIHLRPRPATTAALAAGIMHVIFREGLEDKEFCDEWVYGIHELRDYVKAFTPERVEKITWVPREKIIDAARLYATHRPGGLMTGAQGTTHDLNATNNHRAILMIPAICGYIDMPGGILKPTDPLVEMSAPNWADGPPKFCMRDKMLEMTNYRLDLQDFPVWAEKLFEVQTNHLVEWIKEGKIKALLGWGLNTMIWPQTHEYQQALEGLMFTMAVDYFYRPWTHDYVDLVLPAAMNYERLAPFAYFGRQIFGRTPIKPRGECKEDWQIALDIGVRLGYEDTFFNGDVEAACNDILGMWGLSYDDLRRHQVEGVSVPGLGRELYRKYETGDMRPDKKRGFMTPSGKVEAVSLVLEKHGYPGLPVYKEPMETTLEFPLILISGARVPYITHSKWREDSPWLLELQRDPLLTINPKDAAERDIREGEEVLLRTAYGQIRVKAKPTIMVPPGVVGMMHGWAKANVNELIPRQFDPISGFPPFKEVVCEVLKA